ncbi:MAG TPA: hypothetical protein VFZ97_17330 [Acidimicrobiales bacterium]
MLTAFPLTEVDRIVRRTAYSTIGAGIAGAALAILLGQPLVAPGLALGIALAIANHRVFQSSAMRFTTPEGMLSRKPFAGSVALRLGACTAVAIGLLIVARPMGWGVVAGLAVFQFMMLLNALVSLARYQRREIGSLAVPEGADE